MVSAMALINGSTLYLLIPAVKQRLQSHLTRLKSGKIRSRNDIQSTKR